MYVRKERIRNVTIRQQIGLEETVIKETEQNQLTWYGQVQRMAPHNIKRDHKRDVQMRRTLNIHERKDKNVKNFGGET